MEKIKSIDIFVLDKIFQPITDWIMDTTHISCFVVARLCVIVDVGLGIENGILQEKFTTSLMILSAIIAFSMFLNIQFVEWATKKEKGNPGRSYCWILRVFSSIIFIVGLLLRFHPLLETISYLSFCCAWYFMSCQLRHPRKRTQTKLVFSGAS